MIPEDSDLLGTQVILSVDDLDTARKPTRSGQQCEDIPTWIAPLHIRSWRRFSPLPRGGTSCFFAANPRLHGLKVRVVLGSKLPPSLVCVGDPAHLRRQRHD